MTFKTRASTFILALALSGTAAAGPVWYPLPAEAYRFGERYPEAQNLLYAFDYGHALVYEKLLNTDGRIANPELFEKQLLAEILAILRNPPTIKVDEEDIAPQYVHTFPLTVSLFDWSHLLHQFVLDVLATSTDRGDAMITRVNEIYDHYHANSRVRITDACKSMDFMDGHAYSKVFREKFPSFNLLIWSYHWFQVRLYEALLKPTLRERDAAVAATVDEFWKLLSDLPRSAPFEMMPMTAAEAPTLARLFPKIPPAFDNNHMLHDVISDILTSTEIQDKRLEGVRTARMAMDPKAFADPHCGHH